MKRIFDIVCAVLAIAFFSPAMLVIVIAIKLDDHGPAIFAQSRVGYGGKEFTLYKFRSMRTDAESDGQPQLFCGEDDCRLTKVGKFLRDHHLDEFPQLWNVLKGDMSFVGPRPERKYYVDKIMEKNPDYKRLFALRPGLFSEATLYNGYTDTMEKMLVRLDMDLHYLDHHTIWTDLRIIWKTSLTILTGKVF